MLKIGNSQSGEGKPPGNLTNNHVDFTYLKGCHLENGLV